MTIINKTIIYLGDKDIIDTNEAGGPFSGGENTRAVTGKKYSEKKTDAQIVDVAFNDKNGNNFLEEDTVYDKFGNVTGTHSETLGYDLGDGPVETVLDFSAVARVSIKLKEGDWYNTKVALLQGQNGAVFIEELSGSPRSLDDLDIKFVKIHSLSHCNFNGDAHLSTDSDVTNTVICFCEGTQIRTVDGDISVENIRRGDLVITDEGKEVPVKWIGRQTIVTRFGAPERLCPVRFAAGSLGPNLPETDLVVTSDHGMLIDGVICHAGALENKTTINKVPLDLMGERFTVFHIETDAHDMILANGAAAETFIDNTSRESFDNYAEYLALFGEPASCDDAPYPRAMSARQVPAFIRARLGIVAAA